MKQKSVSILGCGWYGLPLAKKLLALGYSVKGSTTDVNKLALLAECGVSPYLIQLPIISTNSINLAFFDSDVLILNVPPERHLDIVAIYSEQMSTLFACIEKSALKKLIFISSTSVYPEGATNTNEDVLVIPEKDSGKALLKAEQFFREKSQLKTLILRFAGLIGSDRNPGRFLAEKRDLKDGNAPVNLVHLDDCIQITTKFLEKDFDGEIYNVCGDEHPLRRDYYFHAAVKLGLTPPTFAVNEPSKSYKIIDNSNLKMALGGYEFLDVRL